MSTFARVAVVCLLTVTSFAHASAATEGRATATSSTAHTTEIVGAKSDGARGHYASTPVTLPIEGQNVLAFPPASSNPMTVVYLHGMNGRAENGCPWFRGGASELGWLVCPTGVKSEPNGTASWGGNVVEQGAVVARALRAARDHGASTAPGVAIGFSQGGYVALDLVKTRQARFRGLVLIAAPEAHPSAAKLHEAGVERVALASGSFDAAHDALVLDAKRLEHEGMDVRFYDLGHVGHTYAAEDTQVLRDAIAWAGGAVD